MISIRRSLAIVVVFGGLTWPPTARSVDVVAPKPPEDPSKLFDLKLDWIIQTYETAKRRTLARYGSAFTGGVEDARVKKLMRRELAELDELSTRIQFITESVSEAKAAIQLAGKDRQRRRFEEERWHDIIDKAIKRVGTNLVRIEDRYDPIDTPRKPPLPPAALGQPLVDLSQKESMEVEKAVRKAIYEPWQDFYVKRERQRGQERDQIKDRRLRKAHLSVDMPRRSTRYDYDVFLRRGRAGDQGVDRVRGTIWIERGGPIGDLGVLVSDGAKATFLYRPTKSPTIAIKSGITVVLTKPLRLDLRNVPADSLLTRIKYGRWAVQTPPIAKAPDPSTANSSAGRGPEG